MIPVLTRQQKILLVAAVVPALVVYWCGQITFFIDSHTYALNGYHLFDPLSGCDYYWRTFGYPLALALTGLNPLKSFEGILLLQMGAAVVMPWMLYRTLYVLSPRWAFVATLLLVASLLPYLFQQTIYPDQLQACLGFVVTYHAVRVMLKPCVRSFAWLCLWCGVIMLFRPTLLAAYVVLPLALWVCLRTVRLRGEAAQPFKSIFMLATLVILAVQVGHAQLNKAVFEQCLERDRAAIPDQYSMLGKQLFVNAYLYSYGIPDVFSSDTGPAAAELGEAVHDFMQTDAMRERVEVQRHLPKLHELAQSSPDPSKLGDYVLSHPHHDYFWLIYFTPVPDSLFLRASLEMYWAHPQILTRLLWISWHGFTFGEAGLLQDGVDMRYIYLVPNFSPAWIILDKNYEILPPRLADELRGHLDYRYITPPISQQINENWSQWFALVAQVVMQLATIGVVLLPLLCATAKARREFYLEIRVLAACELLALIQILPLMLMTIPMFRYQAEAVLVAIPSAAAVAWILWKLFIPKWLAAPSVDNLPSAP